MSDAETFLLELVKWLLRRVIDQEVEMAKAMVQIQTVADLLDASIDI